MWFVNGKLITHIGYSPEVDSLREKMKENEKQVNKLATSLRYKVWKGHVDAPYSQVVLLQE